MSLEPSSFFSAKVNNIMMATLIPIFETLKKKIPSESVCISNETPKMVGGLLENCVSLNLQTNSEQLVTQSWFSKGMLIGFGLGFGLGVSASYWLRKYQNK